MRALTGWLDRWIFGAYHASPADLGLYRVLYAAYVLLAMVPAGLWVDGVPRAFFSPTPSVAALFTDFPPAGMMAALNVLAVVAAGLLLVGWRTPTASVAVGVLLLSIKTWEYSTGKINHDVLMVLVPLLFAGSGWGRAFSVDARRAGEAEPVRPRPSWALALLAFIIGISMFGAGALKLLTGWLDLATQSTYGHLVVNNLGAGREPWLADLALSTRSALVWETADWTATLMELAFVAAMLHPRALRALMAVACLFHLGVWLAFDIVFAQNVLAYGAFVAYAPVLARRPWGRAALAPGWTPSRRAAAAALVLALLAGGVGIVAGAPLEHLLHLQLQELIVIGGAVVSGVHLARILLPRRTSRLPAPEPA